jgi:phosphate/phosphite/phosphonate ABC transporter binding protein
MRKMPVQRIGVIPFYTPEKIWHLFKPFISYLNRETRVPWELKLYSTHETIIDSLCKGEISVAFFGPVPFARVNELCKVKPLLVSVGSDGKPYYRSIIVTNDSSAVSLKSLKGKKFALFKGSSASHIAPLKMLKDEGITIDTIKPVYLEGQDRIVSAILRNEVAAGAVKESLFKKVKGLKLKALKISSPLPHFTFCAHPSLDPEVERQFMAALLKLKPLESPADRDIVKQWDPELQNGFILPPDNYLQDVRKLHEAFKTHAHED